MKKKRCRTAPKGSEEASLSGVKARRKLAFTLTREQVFQKCLAKKHRLICAGEVLALRDLMELRGWSILELARHAQVSRQMISAFLNLERFPTAEVVDMLACPFGMELFEFDLLATFEVRGEVPLWWHGA
jgi:antitoxin component HigA of HigAB toxin-antitoxin module